MNKKQKLSVSVECRQHAKPLVWYTQPEPNHVSIINQQTILDYHLEFSKVFRLAIVMTHDAEPGDFLKIKQITLNNIVLQNWCNWSTYINDHGHSQTFGHMVHKGKYLFTIRQNALVHNYIASWWNHDLPA